jgi:hypothetical protein
MRLLDAMLKALPDILTGRRLATDVLFPGSSFERVEGIYRDNAIADYFNNALAESVAAWIALRVEAQPEAKMRILEIGAGTGGTTAAVLEKLGPWKANLGEYCFTDLSAAFLARAEEVWGAQHPYLRTRRLDAEHPRGSAQYQGCPEAERPAGSERAQPEDALSTFDGRSLGGLVALRGRRPSRLWLPGSERRDLGEGAGAGGLWPGRPSRADGEGGRPTSHPRRERRGRPAAPFGLAGAGGAP